MKAIDAGRVLGIAMEEFNPSSPTATGTVMFMVNLHYSLGENPLLAISNMVNHEVPLIAPIDTSSAPSTTLSAVTSPSYPISATLMSLVLDGFKQMGVIIQNGLVKVQHLIASLISTKRLEVGTADEPSGITLYDRATKQPYCLIIENGAIKRYEGKCENIDFANYQGSIDIVPSSGQSAPPAVNTNTISFTPEAPANSTSSSSTAQYVNGSSSEEQVTNEETTEASSSNAIVNLAETGESGTLSSSTASPTASVLETSNESFQEATGSISTTSTSSQ
jgi:hypothetical protein